MNNLLVYIKKRKVIVVRRKYVSGPFLLLKVFGFSGTLTSLTSMLVAPASKEFSMSSFTTLTTEVIIWELERRRTVAAGNCFILAFSKVARRRK